MRDFTKERKKLEFKIDDDVFVAASAIPAEVLLSFAREFAGMDPETTTVDQQLRAFEGVLDIVLTDESLVRFKERMNDKLLPIDMEQIEQIVTWLFEEYGLRPTEAASTSSDGQPNPDSGTNSMEERQLAVSASGPSL